MPDSYSITFVLNLRQTTQMEAMFRQTDFQCYWNFRWRMGTHVMVFLHDYKTIKEAYSKTEVSDRPDWFFYNIGENPGLGKCVFCLVYA